VAVALFSLLPALAQAPEQIRANQNRTPAGKLENGVLTLHLELRSGAWHAEADDGPQLFVQAFGEAGQPAQIPGPLMRMPTGTTVHVTVANKLKKKATVYGLNTRPGDQKGVELRPDESRELSFAAGQPGTYFYWARTDTPVDDGQPYLGDAQLNGAYVVDPAGAVPADRIFLMNLMLVPPDPLHDYVEVVSINGKSYPYTEPLEYTENETIRWRVINASFSEHPMHLHGAFYNVLSLGDFESDMSFDQSEQRSVVTENLRSAHTMMLEWKPGHTGRWLFHCHFQAHVSSEERLPVFHETESPHYNAAPVVAAAAHESHDSMSAMNDMAGLVMVINVRPKAGAAPAPPASVPTRKFDLVIEPTATSEKSPTFSCSVREGKKIVASADKSMGPPIVVIRGEPTEITVTNHLPEATTIHWHGLELESYYDGVIGGGNGDQVTPAIAPGGTFVARFTPNRAGTFIYHTHVADPDQLTGGVYGALIVLDPGESFDSEHDKLLVLGTREASFFAKRITVNGTEEPSPMVLTRGVKYRLRLINMAPDLAADFKLGVKEHPASWRAIAKDGATLPTSFMKRSDAATHIASGETYDFEFQPDAPGEIPLQVENIVNHAKLLAKVVVQ
jgi:FtsP/CotA-like multicopper oxidase with cupredoxin domain